MGRVAIFGHFYVRSQKWKNSIFFTFENVEKLTRHLFTSRSVTVHIVISSLRQVVDDDIYT